MNEVWHIAYSHKNKCTYTQRSEISSDIGYTHSKKADK